MPTQISLIHELEDSIREGSPDQRIATLRRVTDLFVHRAELYDDEQIRLFDEVIVRLAAEMETAALAELSRRLAPLPNAPSNAVKKLAHDARIEVAGPVLEQSIRVDDADLVEIASTRGQQHLLAISGRGSISPAVTDVLVERGDDRVAGRVAANDGAQFSESGFSDLVDRSRASDELAETVSRRIDIPPHLFRRLVSEAAERVQQKMLANARPEMRLAIESLLAEISGKVAASPQLASRKYSAARSFVQVLGQSGKLGLADVVKFAKAGRFEEVVAALSTLAGVPIDIVDRVMHGDSLDPLLVLCRAKRYDWPTVRALLVVRRNCRQLSPQDLEEACRGFNLLSATTAERVLRFWQVRNGA